MVRLEIRLKFQPRLLILSHDAKPFQLKFESNKCPTELQQDAESDVRDDNCHDDVANCKVLLFVYIVKAQ